MTAIGAEAGLLDEDGTPAERAADPVRRLARRGGRWRGVASSSNTSYIESASGVGEGARTGLASVVTGVLFLLAIVLRAAGRGRPVRGGDAGAGRWSAS